MKLTARQHLTLSKLMRAKAVKLHVNHPKKVKLQDAANNHLVLAKAALKHPPGSPRGSSHKPPQDGES